MGSQITIFKKEYDSRVDRSIRSNQSEYQIQSFNQFVRQKRMIERKSRFRDSQRKNKLNMTSPAVMNNDNGSILVSNKDPRMLYDEEGLNMQKSDEDDDQIKE